MASKYTAVLVGALVALALLSSAEGRRELSRPWPWLGAAAALAAFSPVVYWNWRHDWASFRFQLHHGSVSETPVRPAVNLLTYVSGQAVVWTPVLFVFSVVVLVAFWRRFARLAAADRVLLLAATVPLLFFGVSSLRREPEANWPMLAYLPLTVLIAGYVAETWGGLRWEWVKIGVIVAACGTAVLHVPEVLRVMPLHALRVVPGKWNDLFSWDDLGRAVDAVRDGSPVYASTYETAAELSFYTTGRPTVWTIDRDRMNEYSYLPGRPDPAAYPRVVFVRQGARDPLKVKPYGPLPEELTRSFDQFAFTNWEGRALGRYTRTRQIVVAVRSPAIRP